MGWGWDGDGDGIEINFRVEMGVEIESIFTLSSSLLFHPWLEKIPIRTSVFGI